MNARGPGAGRHSGVIADGHDPFVEWLGDLWTTFLTSLYVLRVPIAIGSVIAVVVLAFVARRRGWFGAARRHPARTVALGIALAVIGLPTAWYLGSPLFIRTALDEPAPIVAATLPPSAAPTSGPGAVPSPAVEPGPIETSGAAPSPSVTAEPLAAPRSGKFEGADDFHFGRGRASLIETAPGTWIVRFENFSVRNGPDLFVYLSPDADGYVKGSLELGRLEATDGNFNTDVPAGSDVSDVKSVVIWCKQFAVQFAVAALAD